MCAGKSIFGKIICFCHRFGGYVLNYRGALDSLLKFTTPIMLYAININDNNQQSLATQKFHKIVYKFFIFILFSDCSLSETIKKKQKKKMLIFKLLDDTSLFKKTIVFS